MANETKSRKELAEILNVSRKTLWLWLKEIELEENIVFPKRGLLTPKYLYIIYRKFGLTDRS